MDRTAWALAPERFCAKLLRETHVLQDAHVGALCPRCRGHGLLSVANEHSLVLGNLLGLFLEQTICWAFSFSLCWAFSSRKRLELESGVDLPLASEAMSEAACKFR